MAKRIIKLNESDIARMVMNVLNEVAGGFSDDDEYYGNDDNNDDDFLNNFPDLDLNAMEKEYHGQGEENEFNNDDDDTEEYADDDQMNPETDDYPEETEEENGEENLEGDENEMEPEAEEPEDGDTEGFDDDEPIVPDTDPEDEKPHQDGDVVMYENIPITYKDGKWHMTIEDGYEEGDNKCPRIDVVGSKIKDVKGQYDFLWDSISYREHGDYARDLVNLGKAQYNFSKDMIVGGDNTPDLTNSPIVIDTDKQ